MCNVGDYVFDKYVKVDNRVASKCRPDWSKYTDEYMWQGKVFLLEKPKHGPVY